MLFDKNFASISSQLTLTEAGTIKLIVKLSLLGIHEPEGVFTWGDEHKDVENLIREAGIPLTSLRPASFHSNLWMDVQTIKQNVDIELV